MMTPESSKRAGRPRANKVSPQHTLERVRNNQRQHRARRAEYVATMERKLAEAEFKITDLESQLRMAQAGLVQSCHRRPSMHTGNSGPVLSPINDVMVTLTDWSPDLLSDPFPSLVYPQADDYRAFTAVAAHAPEDMASTTTELEIPPLPQSAVPGWALDIEPVVPESMTDHACGPITTPFAIGNDGHASIGALDFQNHLPTTLSMAENHHAHLGGEMTLLCSEAYILVAQYNSKGFSPLDVATWLWQGFRGSIEPGGGCRVEAASLFRLLAFLSADQGANHICPTAQVGRDVRDGVEIVVGHSQSL